MRKRTFFRDPYDFVESDRELGFWALGLISSAIGLFVFLGWLDAPLQDRILSPEGMLTLQLNGDYEATKILLASWGPRGRAIASFCVGLDYVLILTYVAGVSALFAWLARKCSGAIRISAILCSWASTIPGVFDSIENVALYHLLTEQEDPKWVAITSACAHAKFSVLGILIVAAFFVAVARFFHLRR